MRPALPCCALHRRLVASPCHHLPRIGSRPALPVGLLVAAGSLGCAQLAWFSRRHDFAPLSGSGPRAGGFTTSAACEAARGVSRHGPRVGPCRCFWHSPALNPDNRRALPAPLQNQRPASTVDFSIVAKVCLRPRPHYPAASVVRALSAVLPACRQRAGGLPAPFLGRFGLSPSSGQQRAYAALRTSGAGDVRRAC
jgi:hypothetical protein